MPYGDQTGPLGLGAGTGRGKGICGFGRRIGRHLHLRGRFWQAKPDMTTLEQEEKALEQELAAIREEKKNLKEEK